MSRLDPPCHNRLPITGAYLRREVKGRRLCCELIIRSTTTSPTSDVSNS